jgi:acid phosphatase
MLLLLLQAAAAFERFMVIVLENENRQKVMNHPYFKELAQEGTLLANYEGITHPSQGNYLSMISGYRHWVLNGDLNLPHTTLVDLLEEKSISWKTYQEDMPHVCYKKSQSPNKLYRRKHNPFMSFTTISENPSRCSKIVPASEFETDVAQGTLPRYIFYTPNMMNDGHDTGIDYAAVWLRKLRERIDWSKFGNYVLLITFDESWWYFGNNIYSVLLGTNVTRGFVDHSKYNHFSQIKTLQEAWGLSSLNRLDAKAKSFYSG